MYSLKSRPRRCLLACVLATAAVGAAAPPAAATDVSVAALNRKVVTYTERTELVMDYELADATVGGDAVDSSGSEAEAGSVDSSAALVQTQVESPGSEPLAPSADAALDLQPSTGLIPQTGGELMVPVEGGGTENQRGSGSYLTQDSCRLFVYLHARAGYTNNVLTDVVYDSDVISDCSSAEPYMHTQAVAQRGSAGLHRSNGYAKCTNCTQSFSYVAGTLGPASGEWYAVGHFAIKGFKGQTWRSVSERFKVCSTSGTSLACTLKTTPFIIPAAL